MVSRTIKTNTMKEYTCCGVEITYQIKEKGRCPKCSENL